MYYWLRTIAKDKIKNINSPEYKTERQIKYERAEKQLTRKGTKTTNQIQLDFFGKLNRQLRPIEERIRIIKRIQKCLRVCSMCGVYHEKNLEERRKSWERLKTPKWEQEIIMSGFNSCHNLAYDSLLLLAQALIDNELDDNLNLEKIKDEYERGIK